MLLVGRKESQQQLVERKENRKEQKTGRQKVGK
jgi:hypothetical protein